jgi:hypothetical protein
MRGPKRSFPGPDWCRRLRRTNKPRVGCARGLEDARWSEIESALSQGSLTGLVEGVNSLDNRSDYDAEALVKMSG